MESSSRTSFRQELMTSLRETLGLGVTEFAATMSHLLRTSKRDNGKQQISLELSQWEQSIMEDRQ